MGRRSDHSRKELRRLALDSARGIAESDGYRALTVRRIADRLGYAPGTLYNLFNNLDELVLRLRGETLDELYALLSETEPVDGFPEARLMALAQTYIQFVREHPKLWNLMFEHTLPDGELIPDWYREKSHRLLGLVERAIQPLFKSGEEKELQHHAQVLWAAVHGVCSVKITDRLIIKTDTADEMVRSLILHYIDGLRERTGSPSRGSHRRKPTRAKKKR